jgi:predicted GNAT family acetyltransferase
MVEDSPAQVADNAAAERYEVTVDGAVAGFAAYHDRGRTRSFTHTEIDPSYEGRGLGGILVQVALDDARARGFEVLPFCPFVRSFIQRHPAYIELVPAGRRAEFELAVRP